MNTRSLLIHVLLIILVGGTIPPTVAGNADSGKTATLGHASIPPLFSPDSEWLITIHPNGRIQKHSLPGLRVQAEKDLGEPLQGAALSHDGRILALGAPRSNRLLILETDTLRLAKAMATRPTRDRTARIAHIKTSPRRNTFLITFENAAQLWEVNYQNPPPAGFGNWVHDYRKDSGEAVALLFPVRKLWLDAPLPWFQADEQGVFIAGIRPDGGLLIFDLDLGRSVAHTSTAPAATRSPTANQSNN
jgi:hypothetical protein